MFKKIKKVLLSILGDIKVFKFPFFMIYDPGSYKIKGYHTREAMNLLNPGDIILRKYVNYLDGYFIPGTYSHTGIYVGGDKVIHAIAEGVQEIDVIDFLRCDGFCILRQDSKDAADKAIEFVRTALEKGKEYDFDFKSENDAYYCHELGAEAYKDLGIGKKKTKIFGIQLEPRFLAESFLEDPQFRKILEY